MKINFRKLGPAVDQNTYEKTFSSDFQNFAMFMEFTWKLVACENF